MMLHLHKVRVGIINTYDVRSIYYKTISDWCDANIGRFAWKWVWEEDLLIPNEMAWATHVGFTNPEDATMFALAFPG